MFNACKFWIGLWLSSTFCLAQTAILPLAEVRPGMVGAGKTIFAGNELEDFKVEILGVLANSAPGQSIILAKLSGGPLAESGVIQGMSGSPVYVDGKLIGAVALGFPMAKQAICGIRPIEEMLAVPATAPAPSTQQATDPSQNRRALPVERRVLPGDQQVDHVFPEVARYEAGNVVLEPIRTPLQLSGFSPGTLKHFAPMAERLGLSLAQGFSGGQDAQAAAPGSGSAALAKVEPGSMISVQMMRGDMQIAADGTVTHVDGNQIHAFGHRFLAIGSTALPFAQSEVITVLPNLSTSFKITKSGAPLGVIHQDRNASIAGVLGEQADMAPMRVKVTRASGGQQVLERDYRMEMVKDPYLAPLLLQMALFSAVDSTERSVGAASLDVDATLRFESGLPPLRIRNLYSGSALVGLVGALGVSVPAGYALQSGFSSLKLESVEMNLALAEERRELRLEQMWTSTKEASPGEEVEIHAILMDPDGVEQRQRFVYRVPRGAPAGPLYFSAADASSLNMLDYPRFTSLTPKSPEQLLDLIGSLRSNNKLYLRVWRQEPTYSIQGADLPAPPPSAALILDRSTDVKGGRAAVQNAALTELSADLGSYAVTGSKTIQIEVKKD